MCNGGCDMRPDRVYPPSGSTGIDGGVSFYQPGGFGNPLIGNPRGEPSSGLPTTKVQGILDNMVANAPSAAQPGDPGAGAALATSSSGSPILDAAKEHWMWLAVAALVAAALWVK